MASLTEEITQDQTAGFTQDQTAGFTHPGFTQKDALTTISDIYINPYIRGIKCKENQDSILHTTIKLKDNVTKVTLLIVCDGHGALHGSKCSQFVIKFLNDIILQKLNSSSNINDSDGISEILKSTFIESHHNLLLYLNQKIPYSKIENGLIKDKSTQKHILCGTTATVALIINGKLFVANCGDSEILLLQETDEPIKILTENHDPTSLSEFRRVKKGVQENKYESGLQFLFTYPRHYIKPIRNDSGEIINKTYTHKNVRGDPGTIVTAEGVSLAFCRTIGDYYLQKYGVICEPSINIIDTASIKKGSYLLVMSDGVSDNWHFEDIHQTIFSQESSTKDKLDSIMLENLGKSWNNFKDNMDNQSALLHRLL
jgi:serine/threonine protein phosphatase PrpC